MASSAAQVAYRQEIINGFDKTQSVLRETVTTEFVQKGGSAVFLVADTINQVAHTRGINGQIPADPLALTQNTATLVPWHKLVTVSDFNMFESQGDLHKPMQSATMAAINRKIDDDIITILGTTSVNAGTSYQTMTVEYVMHAMAILGVNKVPNDGQLTLLITPAALAYLMQTKEFNNSQVVATRPYGDGGPAFGDKRMAYKWAGLTVIVDPTLSGVGTSSEKCYLYHKSAVGHALNKNALDFRVGFNEEQLYSWANCTAFFGSVKLQGTGIVEIRHDGSAYA